MTSEELMKNADLEKIASEGASVYEGIKEKYDPAEKGKFLAIEIESKKAYLGATSAEAVSEARKHHPNKIFYVLKIGYDTVETMANFIHEIK